MIFKHRIKKQTFGTIFRSFLVLSCSRGVENIEIIGITLQILTIEFQLYTA